MTADALTFAAASHLNRDAIWQAAPPLAAGCEHDLRCLPVIEFRQTVLCLKCRGLAVEVSLGLGATPGAYIVHEDGRISLSVLLQRRDPAEAAERIRTGYADLGIPSAIGEAMIKATLADG